VPKRPMRLFRMIAGVVLGFLLGIVAIIAIMIGSIGWNNSVEASIINDHEIIEYVNKHGYENPRILERHDWFPYRTFGCTQAEPVGFKISATNNEGNRVELDLCCVDGLNKLYCFAPIEEVSS
jgi:hypothetical protein